MRYVAQHLSIFFILTMMSQPVYTASTEDGLSSLPIPPLLESKEGADGVRRFNLVADEGRRRFLGNGETSTLGYNGNYLGPTIRVRRGERIAVRVENRLDHPTTVHWHGADVPAEADGGPHQVIDAGGVWEPEFPVRQRAATLWYHPHMVGTTAKQVYQGLAGLFIIDDEESDRLDLPDEYGVDDIPLILQERRFDDSGRFRYAPRMPDVVHGYFGNALLTNGVLESYFPVDRKAVRLRILNGSNSTVLRLSFDGAPEFHQIASDGGLLPRALAQRMLILSPGERAEIVVDFSLIPQDAIALIAETNSGERYRALEFRVSGDPSERWNPPERLSVLETLDEDDADASRRFSLATGMGGRMTINGKMMRMDRIDERVPLGNVEIWELENAEQGMMMNQPHSFHVHAVQFRVLDINGQTPPEHLAGWKDTILLWPGDRVRIIARFASHPGLFMYHCHLLEHEDSGMMGQFMIE